MSQTTVPRRTRAPHTPSPFAIQRAMEQALEARKQLLQLDPTIADDPKLYADTLEGVSDDWAKELEAILLRRREAEDFALLVAEKQKDLAVRKKRYEQEELHWRKAALEMMQTLDVRRFELAEVTASIRNGSPQAVGNGTDGLAPEFLRVTVAENRPEILKALKAGEDVPGYSLSNPAPSLVITER